MLSQCVTISAFVAVIAFTAPTQAYQRRGHGWGYKTEIYHPAKSYSPKYDHYHAQPMHEYYPAKKTYYIKDDHYQGDNGAYSYVHRYDSSPHYSHQAYIPVRSYKMSYPEPKPAPTTTAAPPPPPPKKEDDEHSFKINFDMGLNKMFEKHLDKEIEEPKKEEEAPVEQPEMSYGMYGRKRRPATPAPAPPPPAKEKKEFEIKIPKIDVEDMIDNIKGKL